MCNVNTTHDNLWLTNKNSKQGLRNIYCCEIFQYTVNRIKKKLRKPGGERDLLRFGRHSISDNKKLIVLFLMMKILINRLN